MQRVLVNHLYDNKQYKEKHQNLTPQGNLGGVQMVVVVVLVVLYLMVQKFQFKQQHETAHRLLMHPLHNKKHRRKVKPV